MLIGIIDCKSTKKSLTTISMKKLNATKRKCAFKKRMTKMDLKLNRNSGISNKTKKFHVLQEMKKMGIKNAHKMEDTTSGTEEKISSHQSMFLVHQQPDVIDDTGEDGSFPIRDEWLDITNRIDEHPSAEELAYNSASQMGYLIRERQNDESCKSSVAACDAYTSMWPQIDGLCDLFFVKCLVEVAGMICRNYTEKDIFKYAADLCDNVSDFCSQNRIDLNTHITLELFQILML
uniref:Saposin B-type domain-containing protein n=1 Tax=Loa loa TaxID=7209 RepID=A0A1I7V6P7_LOALO